MRSNALPLFLGNTLIQILIQKKMKIMHQSIARLQNFHMDQIPKFRANCDHISRNNFVSRRSSLQKIRNKGYIMEKNMSFFKIDYTSSILSKV